MYLCFLQISLILSELLALPVDNNIELYKYYIFKMILFYSPQYKLSHYLGGKQYDIHSQYPFIDVHSLTRSEHKKKKFQTVYPGV